MKGTSTETTLKWLHWVVQKKYLRQGELLLMDRHDGHLAEDVQHFLQSQGIHYLYFPVASGAYLNPCDNSFNADFKHKFYQLLSSFSSVNHTQKIQLAFEAYNLVKDESVLGFFRKCCLLEGKPERLVPALLSEGYDFQKEWKSHHDNQYRMYHEFAVKYGILSSQETDISKPIQGTKDGLNGKYWTNWKE